MSKTAARFAAVGCLLLCIIMGVMQLADDPTVDGREKGQMVVPPALRVGPRSGPADCTERQAEVVLTSSSSSRNLHLQLPSRVMTRPVIPRARSPPA